MATYIVRVGAGDDALKLSEVLGECDQDVVAVPLPIRPDVESTPPFARWSSQVAF